MRSSPRVQKCPPAIRLHPSCLPDASSPSISYASHVNSAPHAKPVNGLFPPLQGPFRSRSDGRIDGPCKFYLPGPLVVVWGLRIRGMSLSQYCSRYPYPPTPLPPYPHPYYEDDDDYYLLLLRSDCDYDCDYDYTYYFYCFTTSDSITETRKASRLLQQSGQDRQGGWLVTAITIFRGNYQCRYPYHNWHWYCDHSFCIVRLSCLCIYTHDAGVSGLRSVVLVCIL